MPHGQDAGFLGKAHDPFVLMADPSKPSFRFPDLLPPQQIGEARISRRRRLRDIVDNTVERFEQSENAQLLDSSFQAAFRIVTSQKARDAFDLSKESTSIRDAYGMSRFGQSCLLARRLIEAGVRFVTINTFLTVFDEITWDIHGTKPFTSIEGMRDIVAPMYDKAYSALLQDLALRGMLDGHHVCNLTEFDERLVLIPLEAATTGLSAGPPILRVVVFRVAGVVGRSDPTGGYPAERPVAPNETVATIYHSLGFDLETELPGPAGRRSPWSILGQSRSTSYSETPNAIRCQGGGDECDPWSFNAKPQAPALAANDRPTDPASSYCTPNRSRAHGRSPLV